MTGWLTTKQVGIRLGISPTAVLRLKDRATLAGYWSGRTWFFRETAVEALERDPAYQKRTRRVEDAAS